MNNNQRQLSLPEIKKRILSSFMSLTARQIALRAIGFISLNIILAKVLPVETLGIFNIAISIITFFAFFSDVGLAASLIQKEKIDPEDIKTTFTIQQLLVGTLSLIIIAGASFFGQFYNLDEGGVWLIRILGIAFFLASLKVVPSVLLERELRFTPLVAVEVVETVLFNGLLIALVLLGGGIWSFSVAALVRGLAGVVMIYVISPARVGFEINRTSAAKLLSFGIPYQLNSLLALLKDRLVPLVIAKMVGFSGVGYITWSQAVAFLPLEIMNIVIRITFPAFSRLQDNKDVLSKAVEKSLFVTTLVVYPLLFGLAAILPSVVSLVVSPKWQPATLSFYLFAFSALWAVVSTVLTNTLNAMGYIKTTLKLMVFWTVLTWILTPVLTMFYGFLGVSLASFLISFTSVLTVVLVKRVLAVRVMEAIVLPLFSAAVMGGGVYLFSQAFVKNIPTLILAILLGGFIYSLLVLLWGKEKVLGEIKSLRHG